MKENTSRLRQIMQERGLSLADVASITGRSYKTVRRWRSRSGHPIPKDALELLEMKTKEAA